MLGGEVPAARSNTREHLTETQQEVVDALVALGFTNKDAVSMVEAAEGTDFESLFRSAQAQRAGKVSEVAESDQGNEVIPSEQQLGEPVAAGATTQPTEPSTDSEPASVTVVTDADAAGRGLCHSGRQ